MTIYLDHAATTTIRPVALEALGEAYESYDRNASGLHSGARAAKNALEDARERAAALLGVAIPLDIIFTASGTEADNLAVVGASLASRERGVAVSEIEHDAVIKSARSIERFGYTIYEIPVSREGVVAVDHFGAGEDPELALLSVMFANNEIGAVQPVREIAEAARAASGGVLVHTDAVQAWNSHEVTLQSTGADLISLASHKFGGPKGVGLLALREGVTLEPVIHGGGQEGGRRAGTYNVAGVVAMVAAMEEAASDRVRFSERTSRERDSFEEKIREANPSVTVTSQSVDRLPHISHIRFPGVLAETLLIRLDQEGISAAGGSACQSGAVTVSHVLTAIGLSDVEATECVRFSFGWDTETGVGLDAAAVVAEVLRSL